MLSLSEFDSSLNSLLNIKIPQNNSYFKNKKAGIKKSQNPSSLIKDNTELLDDEINEYKNICSKLREMSHIAQVNYKEAKLKIDDTEKELESVENQIAIKYSNEQDNEQKLIELKIRSDNLTVKNKDLLSSINKLNSEIQGLQNEIGKLKKKKKVSKILKFIPIVNLGAAVYDAIEKNDEKIARRNRDINDYKKKLDNINKELDKCNAEITSVKSQTELLKKSISELEDKRKSLQSERESLKNDLVEWDNRKVQCKLLADGIENILDTCEDKEEIESDIKNLQESMQREYGFMPAIVLN